MIKGALIFGAGVGVGYGLALSHNEDIRDAAQVFKQFLQDEALKSDVERRQAADAQADAEGRPNTATDGPQESASGKEEVVEAEVLDVDEPDEEPGETPS